MDVKLRDQVAIGPGLVTWVGGEDSNPTVSFRKYATSCLPEEVMPWTQKLPEIARWFAEYPDLVDDLMALATIEAVESDGKASLWAEFSAKRPENGFEHMSGKFTRKADGLRAFVVAIKSKP